MAARTPARSSLSISRGCSAPGARCRHHRQSWSPATTSVTAGRLGRRSAVPGDAWVTYAPFRGVLLVECEGDPVVLASELARVGGRSIARVAAVLAQVPSARREMLEAVGRVGPAQIRPGESFAVRVHRRGFHGYLDPGPTLERDAGAAVWQVLRDRDGTAPRVELSHPDVTVHVEVLGPRSLVCVARRDWAGGVPDCARSRQYARRSGEAAPRRAGPRAQPRPLEDRGPARARCRSRADPRPALESASEAIRPRPDRSGRAGGQPVRRLPACLAPPATSSGHRPSLPGLWHPATTRDSDVTNPAAAHPTRRAFSTLTQLPSSLTGQGRSSRGTPIGTADSASGRYGSQAPGSPPPRVMCWPR